MAALELVAWETRKPAEATFTVPALLTIATPSAIDPIKGNDVVLAGMVNVAPKLTFKVADRVAELPKFRLGLATLEYVVVPPAMFNEPAVMVATPDRVLLVESVNAPPLMAMALARLLLPESVVAPELIVVVPV